MSAFSPSLMLAGMDYIAPSMECIKPTQVKERLGREGPSGVIGRRRHTADDCEESLGVGGRQEVMRITLADCLACSGCVTTAETVLVEAQSRQELCSALGLPVPPSPTGPQGRSSAAAGRATGGGGGGGRESGDSGGAAIERQQRPVLVTISEQSAASLAAHCDVELVEALRMISGFLRKTFCVDGRARTVYVSDLRWALEISTTLTTEEYQRRIASVDEKGEEDGVARLPMLVSACPGWVCYCEKQGAALLPLLSPVLSPQGVAGSLAKRVVHPQLYHVSIQPCFDRKLEAARDGFYASGSEAGGGDGGVDAQSSAMTPYTDCVLSTAELLEWMTDTDPSLPWRAELDSTLEPLPPPVLHAGGGNNNGGDDDQLRLEGSGGYHRRVLEAVARAAAAAAGAGNRHHSGGDHPTRDEEGEQQQQQQQPASVIMRYEAKRNRNHLIVSCPAIPATAAVSHGFCVAYGFQQIQNIVRGIRKNLPAVRSYTFVELMACPDGCLNGGGQVRVASGNPEAHAAQLAKTEHEFTRWLSREGRNALRRTKGAEEAEADVDVGADAGERLFSRASVLRMMASVDPSAFRCTFRDRQKEFEETLDRGNVHSLKW